MAKQPGIVLLRLGPCRVVLTLVSAASYAKGPSQITSALHLARQQRASVYLVRPEHPLNAAVFDLRSPDVRILPERRWLSAFVRRRWDAVVRRGDPTALATLDPSASIARRPVTVRFHPAAEAAARARARALGIADGARIVTLHVREGGFKGSIGQEERGKDAIRNCRIETYFDAIDYLVGRGRTVVRIGDPTMTPIERRGVVDLATSTARDPWVELWCMMNAEFFLASQSGPYSMAMLTNTPVLMVNVVNPLAAYPHRRQDLYILKHVIERATGRELPLAELVGDEATLHGTGDLGRYAFADNSSSEIVDAVQEMIAALQAWPTPRPSQEEFARAIRRLQASERSRAKLAHKGFTATPFEREGRIAGCYADRYFLGGGG